MSETNEIGIGIIGGGYMGKAHSVAMSAVGAVFNTKLRPRLEMIAASSDESAQRYRRAYGFARACANWQELVADPKVQAVVIASPQSTHLEIAKAALALSKPVFCEKPMGASLDESREMLELANKANTVNMVGFNYIRTPASQYARQLIAEGAIGDVIWFRGEHCEDFYADPDAPATWRTSGDANGTMGDLAGHMINATLALIGSIKEVNAVIDTVYKTRPNQHKGEHKGDNGINGRSVEVTNDDHAQMMCRFDSGAMGQLYFSRVATGRKMGYAYEIHGTKGAIRFDQEDQNALWLFLREGEEAKQGFRKILTGPSHPDYLPFCQGGGHGTGYQDQIIIEAHDFLEAIASKKSIWPTFSDGHEVNRVIAAARASDKARSWAALNDFR